MFFEAAANLGGGLLAIPLATLGSQTSGVLATVGLGVPAAVVGRLGDLGLFSHAAAETVAKSIFEMSGKTLTGHWMDATGPFRHLYPKGVSVGWHRGLHGHHFISDALTALRTPDLSVGDLYGHLATDIVTQNGLPLLPGEVTRSVAALLGTTPTQLIPWISLNILDIGASCLAISNAASNVTAVLSGTARWGAAYALKTIGSGAIEITAGIAAEQPIFVVTGGTNVVCGVHTAVDYYSQPFLCGVPLKDVLQSAAIGAGVAGMLGVLEVALTQRGVSLGQKAALLAERITSSSLLSALSTISAPVGVVAAFGLTGIQLAKAAANHANATIEAMPVAGPFASMLDRHILGRHVSNKTMDSLRKFIE
jgi:hypothetical protein